MLSMASTQPVLRNMPQFPSHFYFLTSRETHAIIQFGTYDIFEDSNKTTANQISTFGTDETVSIIFVPKFIIILYIFSNSINI